jgi:hypothetical protein
MEMEAIELNICVDLDEIYPLTSAKEVKQI